jgi:putative acyl-CoA dehydrogenase
MALGQTANTEATQALARIANTHIPELRTLDRQGRRLDIVEFHPAYHELMRTAYESGVHSLSWQEEGRLGAHTARAALSYVWNQAENGVCCPLAMSFAGVAALRNEPELAKIWEPKITAYGYDQRLVPVQQKASCTIGMAMTEKQGGSDLRATKTFAVPVGRNELGNEYRITGHKWFCSAPMSDVFLTLAQTESGISCFLVPRVLPDGSRNAFLIQRLKDKQGNRSSASSEIEYDNTRGFLVGQEGKGISVILEMGHLTRLDVVMGSSGIMRRALTEAIHHTRNRSAFKKLLSDQPLMQVTLADMAIESEAATAIAMRAAQAMDQSHANEAERLLARILVPTAKYLVCKRAPQFVAEAAECLGGNGFVEESIMPRLYREAPLNSIWEGSGNVICLDVLRALRRAPETREVILNELKLGLAGDLTATALLRDVESLLDRVQSEERLARELTEKLAVAFQYALLRRHAPSVVSDAFGGMRLDGRSRLTYGAASMAEAAALAVLERALPTV